MAVPAEWANSAAELDAWLKVLVLVSPEEAEARFRDDAAMRAQEGAVARMRGLPKDGPADRGGVYFVFPDGNTIWRSDDGQAGRSWKTLPAEAPAKRVIHLETDASPTPIADHCRAILAELRESLPQDDDQAAATLESLRRKIHNLLPAAQANISGMIYRALEPAMLAAAGQFMLSQGSADPLRGQLQTACGRQLEWARENRRAALVPGEVASALVVLGELAGTLDDGPFLRHVVPAAMEWFAAARERRVPLIRDAVSLLVNSLAADPASVQAIAAAGDNVVNRFETAIEASLDSPSLTQHTWNMFDLLPLCRAGVSLLDAAHRSAQVPIPGLAKKYHVAEEYQARLYAAVIRVIQPGRLHLLEMSTKVHQRLDQGGLPAVEQLIDDHIEFKWFYPRCARTTFEGWAAALPPGGREQ